MVLPAARSDSRQSARRFRRVVFESLEARRLLSVAATEQWFVYRLNRARHDPVAYEQEANLPISLSGVAPRPPLAVHSGLFASSEFKAEEMAVYDYFSHQSDVTGVWPNKLLRDNGYPLPERMMIGDVTYRFPDDGNSVESLAAGYPTVVSAMDELIIDEGVNPPGHRLHLLGMTDLYAAAREIGVGHANRVDSTYRDYWAIHLTTSDPTQSFLTGVVHQDPNDNQRYDQGEGLAGVTVSVGDQQTTTNAAGGWALPVEPGEYLVTVSGGPFSGESEVPVLVADANVEADFVSGQRGGYVDFQLWGNTAPTLDASGAPTLSPVVRNTTDPPGTSVAAIVTDRTSDPDPASVEGIALFDLGGTVGQGGSVGQGGGQWQYSLDGGDTWTAVAGVSDSAALLLRTTDVVRFVPATDATGTATLRFRAWDQTSGAAGQTANLSTGTGGSTAFSTSDLTATLTVIAVNTAPALDDAADPRLPDVAEDAATHDAATIGQIVGAAISDPDPGAVQGAALVSQSGVAGTWQYSLDDGAVWLAVGDLQQESARLLRAEDRLRFVPDENVFGAASIRFHAWDQMTDRAGQMVDLSGALGGATSFSTTSDAATVTILPVNDAPTIDSFVQPFLSPIAPNDPFSLSGGDTVADIVGAAILDVDPDALEGIAVIGGSGDGVWWFRNEGSWRNGTIAPQFAWLLKPEDIVQFVPDAGFSGTVELMFHAWDQTTGTEISGVWADLSTSDRTGGTTAYSSDSHTAKLVVGDAGQAPSVAEITRLDSSPTRAAEVRYQVVFDEEVINVDVTDFRVVTDASLSGSVTSVSGAGASRTITVGDLSGSGILRLAFDSSQLDIRDTVGNPLNLAGVPQSPDYEILLLHPWQNPRQRLDVSGDSVVAPNDVLLIVNDINAKGSRQLPVPTIGQTPPPPYVDVNGDNTVAPNDVIIVVNFLNANVGGEGESAAVADLHADPAVSRQAFSDHQPIHRTGRDDWRPDFFSAVPRRTTLSSDWRYTIPATAIPASAIPATAIPATAEPSHPAPLRSCQHDRAIAALAYDFNLTTNALVDDLLTDLLAVAANAAR